MKLGPGDEPLNKSSSQAAISIPLCYIYVKMGRIILANIPDVAEVENIIEMVEG